MGSWVGSGHSWMGMLQLLSACKTTAGTSHALRLQSIIKPQHAVVDWDAKV